jgi:hypothetical protein
MSRNNNDFLRDLRVSVLSVSKEVYESQINHVIYRQFLSSPRIASAQQFGVS